MSSPPLTFEDDLPHVRSDLLRGIGGYWCEFCGEHMPESDDPMGAFRRHLAAVLLAHVREAHEAVAGEFDGLSQMHGSDADKHVAGDSDSYDMGMSRGRSIAYDVAAERLRALTEETR